MVAEQLALDPGFDLTELISRVEGDYDLLRDIFDIFQEEFPRSYQTLIASLASNDLKQVRITAHTLKGMLSSLSFVTATNSARRIEQLACAQQRDGLDEEIALLQQTAHAAQVSLQQACLEARR